MTENIHDAFARIADDLGLGLDPDALRVLTAVGEELLSDRERLDALAAEHLPAPERVGERGGRVPGAEENPHHAWVWRCAIEGAATGPLAGRTVALKDTVSLGGAPLLNGSALLEGFRPSQDATVVERLLAAGATIAGKTAVPAFCCEGAGLIGHPEPLPVNPVDPARLPGGSSSGSAVVVAAGEADLALGGDQGGSIRIPAAWCGCVGLKPTFGLVPYTGVFPVELTLDSVGPMARTVADCARMLDAIAGADGRDPRQGAVPVQAYEAALEDTAPLRIGVLAEGFDIPGASEPEVDALVRETAERLAGAGHEVAPVSVPMHRDGVTIWNGVCLQGLTALLLADEAGTNHRGEFDLELTERMRAIRQDAAAGLPDTVKVTMLAGEHLTREHGVRYYAQAQNLGRVLARTYDAALADVDVLLMPTTPMRAPARPSGMDEDERLLLAIGLESSNNVAPFNVSGHPSLSVPCGTADGLPVGVNLVGRRFDDATVLRAGAAVERVRS